MDSNRNIERKSNASGNPVRNASDKPESFSGNRSSYNKKRKQRHFGPAVNVNSVPGSVNDSQPSVSGNNMLRTPRALNPNQPGQPGNVQRNANPAAKSPDTAPSQNQRPPLQHAANQPNVTNRNFNPQQSAPARQMSAQKPLQQQPAQQQIIHQQHSPQMQQAQQPRVSQPARKWENRTIKIEETFEDIKKDNERIEKEIWLEIAEIHNAKLD